MRSFLTIPLAAGLCVGAAQAEEHVVSMAGSTYSPDMLVAAVGDTVRLINNDEIDHNVFVPTAGHAIDFGKQEPGQEAMLALGKPGKFTVECVIHSGMELMVEVN